MSTNSIALDTLCASILDGWHCRVGGHSNLSAYHCKLLDLMTQELGVVWHDDPDQLQEAWKMPGGDGETMPHILRSICEMYDGIREPFRDFLSYSPVVGEKAVLDVNLDPIAVATNHLRLCWQAWLRDMLLLRWPEAATRTTTWERLTELGLGEPVLDEDFW